MTDERILQLEKQNKELRGALIGIINGCLHPEKAIRRVMLDLKPIREVLKNNPEI